MTMWKFCGAGLVLLVGGASSLWAQIPAAPPGAPAGVPAGIPAPPPLTPPVVVPAAPPRNIFSFFMLTPDQKAACAAHKEKFCASQIGQLLNNSLAPVGAFSGGLIGPCCPSFPQADLLKPPESPEGAAARIKADEAGAKARIADVKYLARVDCHYWPEASDALVSALRADRNECVRLAAAQALGTGCCCNKKTIVALSIAAAGSDRDGNPSESSERVRMAAQISLTNCLSRCEVPIPVAVPPAEGGGPGGTRERPPEVPIKPLSATEPAGKGTVTPAVYYKRIEAMSRPDVIELVRLSVASWPERSATGQPATGQPATENSGVVEMSHVSATGDHSLFGLMASAIGPVKDSLLPPGRRSAPVVVSGGEVSAEPAAALGTGEPAPAAAVQPSPVSPYQPSPIQSVGYQVPVMPAGPLNPEAAPRKPLPIIQPSASVIHTIPVYTPPAANAAPPVSRTVAPGVPTHFPPANGMDVGRLLTMLRDAARSTDRAWAAAELASVDGRGNPDVVEALLAAGRLDAVAVVRTQCIRSLVKMNITTMAVIETLETLRSDADATVQQEARQALEKLTGQDSLDSIP